MKFSTTKPVEVTISFTEVMKGKETQKSFSTDKKTAEGQHKICNHNPLTDQWYFSERSTRSSKEYFCKKCKQDYFID